jgi:phosphoglycolate phosphatase-like HAD superfamily hydrolase
MTIIAFDLDGTLFKTLDDMHRITNLLLKKYGLPQVDRTKYRELFQSNDLNIFCADLGFSSETFLAVQKEFQAIYEHIERPEIIEGVVDILDLCNRKFESVHLITHEKQHRMERRLLESNLRQYFETVVSTKDKTLRISELAAKSKLVYVGDTISDGQACEKSRLEGFNVEFWMICHEHSYNLEKHIHEWAKGKKFVKMFCSMREIRVYVELMN